MRQALDTPWKIWNEAWRWWAYPRVRLLFAINGIPWGRGWRFYGVPVVQKHRRSQMHFGPGLQLRSSIHSNPLGPNHPVIMATWRAGAVLEIGDNFAITGGTLCVAEQILIGSNVTVGANTSIVDADFHSLDAEVRKRETSGGKTAPIVIESDVFIGMNCLILKGVTIGRGSVVGAGSVLTRDVPPDVIVAGNPARIIRELVREG
jgi:acetyltransferase-like isoleucine patch superfamily enzyme